MIEPAGLGADPIPEVEFDQTLGWQTCVVEMAHAAQRGLAWIRRWRGAASGVVCQFRIIGSVHSSLVPRIKSPLKPNNSSL